MPLEKCGRCNHLCRPDDYGFVGEKSLGAGLVTGKAYMVLNTNFNGPVIRGFSGKMEGVASAVVDCVEYHKLVMTVEKMRD